MMTRSNQLKGTNKASFDRFDRKLAFVSYSVVLSPNDITLYSGDFGEFTDIEIYWKSENRIVINGTEHATE